MAFCEMKMEMLLAHGNNEMRLRLADDLASGPHFDLCQLSTYIEKRKITLLISLFHSHPVPLHLWQTWVQYYTGYTAPERCWTISPTPTLHLSRYFLLLSRKILLPS